MDTKHHSANNNIGNNCKNIHSKKSKDYFESIFHSTSTAMAIIDKDIKICLVNTAFEEQSGYTNSELAGKSVINFLPTESVDLVLKYHLSRQVNPDSTPNKYELKTYDKNGIYRDLIITIGILPDNNRVISLIDTTEQRQAERALRISEERFHTLFTNVTDGLSLYELILDTNNKPIDYRIIDVNHSYEIVTGFNRYYVIGKLGSELYSITPPPYLNEYAKCVLTNKKLTLEIYYEQFEKYFDMSIIPWNNTSFVVVLSDISERKSTELIIKRHTERLELLLNISKDFTKVAADNIDNLIFSALQQICEFDNNDRCYVFLFSDDGSKISKTHQWCKDNIICEINQLQNLPPEFFPWWMKRLQNFECINIPRVCDLPDDAQAEKEFFRSQDIQSLLVVPMIYESKLIGFIGFDSVSCEKCWTENSLSLLNIVSSIIANILQRKNYVIKLQESENFYRTIFENTGAAALIIEEDKTISNANNEWKRIFGYKKEELIGRMWSDLFSKDSLDIMEKYHKWRRTTPNWVPKNYQSHIKDSSGKIKDCLIFADIIPGTKKSIANIIDMTEFNRINRALKTTSAIITTLLNTGNEKDLLKQICKDIVNIGGYSFAWVSFVEYNERKSITPIAYAGFEEEYLNTIHISLTEHNIGPNGTAIRTGKPFVCRNIETDPIFAPWRDEALKRGYKSMIALPLHYGETESIGALGIYSDEQDVFDEEEVSLLNNMALDVTYGIISLRTGIERDNYAKELEQSLERLKELFHQTVASLEVVIKIRDPYTAIHQRKVSNLASAIALEMGLPEDQITAILIAATLHDIGKINVPSDILNKPGQLTEFEYGIIKSHSQSGYDVIKNINFPWSIDKIILQHHERIDGSGYPLGIKGDEILLAARILGVADVVEAISSHRPYRPALGIDKALEEISSKKGTLYDPEVVDACLNLFNYKKFEFA